MTKYSSITHIDLIRDEWYYRNYIKKKEKREETRRILPPSAYSCKACDLPCRSPCRGSRKNFDQRITPPPSTVTVNNISYHDGWVHVCMYVWVHVCMYVCMGACMYVCMYVWAWMNHSNRLQIDATLFTPA